MQVTVLELVTEWLATTETSSVHCADAVPVTASATLSGSTCCFASACCRCCCCCSSCCCKYCSSAAARRFTPSLISSSEKKLNDRRRQLAGPWHRGPGAKPTPWLCLARAKSSLESTWSGSCSHTVHGQETPQCNGLSEHGRSYQWAQQSHAAY